MYTTPSLLILAVAVLSIALQACSATEVPEDPVQISGEQILPHILELSSDDYYGRMPFGPGDKKTVNYIVEQCKAAGLEPGNNGSFTQAVPMIEITSTPNSVMKVSTPAGPTQYRFGEDFVIQCLKTVEEVQIHDAEIVFCGYGLVDEASGWNDFAAVDIKNKIAVVLVNDPGYGGEDSTFFKGDEMTYYGRWTYKYEEADRQGAKGLLIIHETQSAGYPWFVVQSSWTGAGLGLEKESVQNGADIKGWIHLDMAKDLFEKCGMNLAEMIRAARQPGFEAVPLNAKLSVDVRNTFKRDVSENVVAMFPGATRPDEYVVYSAHWDHIGIGKVVDGDSIYNGALDNASGTGTLLALANNFTAQELAPERSILFLWVTAEEQGLLGSEYFALNPTAPVDRMVANVNIDGCNPHGATRDFQIIGYGHSEMDDIIAEELVFQDRYVLPDQEAEKGYFFRSDHFNFAKVGVPAMFGNGGSDNIEHGKEWGQARLDEYTAKNYHAPSDEYDPETWDMTGVVQDAQLFYNIGWRLANNEEWPDWSATSEFSRKKSAVD